MRKEIRLSGTGGQGVILAAIILADAAVRERYQVAQSQSYGAEARGGDSSADVIISDEEIDYPKIDQADILLTMNVDSIAKSAGGLKSNGILVYDSSNGSRDVPTFTGRLLGIPISATARELCGTTSVVNMVALGVVVALTDIVSRENLKQALVARVPSSSKEVNLTALEAGFAATT